MDNKSLLDKLEKQLLDKQEFVSLISSYTESDAEYAAQKARGIAQSIYGNSVYIRGLIEVSNYCKNDCYYCGIRRSNRACERYRLTKEDILECCEHGYELGLHTFVLQGGEDLHYTCGEICDIIRSIKKRFPDCCVTLSIGEKSYEEYKAYREAGADRYLLRHETANEWHYSKLHPESMSLKNRMNCLSQLKELGYQTGAGMMVGTPFQTAEHLAEDMLYLGTLQPHMVGIGPFIPHKDTPFAKEKSGDVDLTVFLLSLTRIMLPHALIPATTALGTASGTGRERGILAGANVIMPNLSPMSVRKKYMLYDGKISTGSESADALKDLAERMESIGYRIDLSRGDHK